MPFIQPRNAINRLVKLYIHVYCKITKVNEVRNIITKLHSLIFNSICVILFNFKSRMHSSIDFYLYHFKCYYSHVTIFHSVQANSFIQFCEKKGGIKYKGHKIHKIK